MLPPSPPPLPLLAPCLIPDYDVHRYGGYPGYVERLYTVIEQCNIDKQGLADWAAQQKKGQP